MLEDMESSQDWKLLAQPVMAHADEAEDGVRWMVFLQRTTTRCNSMSRTDLDLWEMRKRVRERERGENLPHNQVPSRQDRCSAMKVIGYMPLAGFLLLWSCNRARASLHAETNVQVSFISYQKKKRVSDNIHNMHDAVTFCRAMHI